MGGLPHVSLTSESLFGAQVVVTSAYVTKKNKSDIQSRFFEGLMKEDRDMGGAGG